MTEAVNIFRYSVIQASEIDKSDTVKTVLIIIIIRPEARLQPNIGFTLERAARCDGVHAFGCNSAESEPIWMKLEHYE